MSYNKLNFVNGQTPAISASNLNHMDQGIADAHAGLADTYTKDEADEALALKANASAVYTKSEVDAHIVTAVESSVIVISGTVENVASGGTGMGEISASDLEELGIDSDNAFIVGVQQKLVSVSESLVHTAGRFSGLQSGYTTCDYSYPAVVEDGSGGYKVLVLNWDENTARNIQWKIGIMRLPEGE